MSVDYKQIAKALQFVTERNPDIFAPVLCSLWDKTTPALVRSVYDTEITYWTTPPELDPDKARQATLTLLEKEQPIEVVDFLRAVAKYAQWISKEAAEAAVVGRGPVPVPDLEPVTEDDHGVMVVPLG